MLSVEYAHTRPGGGERAAYAVVIDGRAAARLVRVDRYWHLEYAGYALTLASPGAATALIERYADKICAGHRLETNEPLAGAPGAKHKAT